MQAKYIFCCLTIFLSCLGIRAGQEGLLLAHYDGFVITIIVSVIIFVVSIIWLIKEFITRMKG